MNVPIFALLSLRLVLNRLIEMCGYECDFVWGVRVSYGWSILVGQERCQERGGEQYMQYHPSVLAPSRPVMWVLPPATARLYFSHCDGKMRFLPCDSKIIIPPLRQQDYIPPLRTQDCISPIAMARFDFSLFS